jgi:sRNA-binding protein
MTNPGDANVVPFQPSPTPEEESARRLKVEVERLSRLSHSEWAYYLGLPGYAEKYGVDAETFTKLVKAEVSKAEKKQREEKAEEQRREQRAEKKRASARREEQRAEQQADKEAKRREKEKQKAFAAILKVPQNEHEGRLAELAKQLGEDIELLRDEFTALVGSEEKIKVGEIEPWPEPVNLQELLSELETQIRRYVIIHEESAAVATVLWVVFAWCHEIATYSPLLIIQGADADSGKSLLSQVIGLLTPRARIIAEPTGPTLYRYVDRYRPTLIIDNANRLLPRRPDLAAIVNASWMRGDHNSAPGQQQRDVRVRPVLPQGSQWRRCASRLGQRDADAVYHRSNVAEAAGRGSRQFQVRQSR